MSWNLSWPQAFCQNEVNNWKWSHLKNEIIYQLQHHWWHKQVHPRDLIWWNVRELFVRWKLQINSSWRISDRHRLLKVLTDRPIWYLIYLGFSPDKVTTCIWRNQVQSVCNLSTVFTMGGTVPLRSPSHLHLFMTGELHSVRHRFLVTLLFVFRLPFYKNNHALVPALFREMTKSSTCKALLRRCPLSNKSLRSKMTVFTMGGTVALRSPSQLHTIQTCS